MPKKRSKKSKDYKKKYSKLKEKYEKLEKEILSPSPTQIYKGYTKAAVIIIEDYYVPGYDLTPCLLLFKDVTTGTYDIPMGIYHPDDYYITKTARRVLQTKSANLIELTRDSNLMYNFDYITPKGFNMKCFIVHIASGKISATDYYSNLRNLSFPGVPPEWTTTNDMIRVPLTYLMPYSGTLSTKYAVGLGSSTQMNVTIGNIRKILNETNYNKVLQVAQTYGMSLNRYNDPLHFYGLTINTVSAKDY